MRFLTKNNLEIQVSYFRVRFCASIKLQQKPTRLFTKRLAQMLPSSSYTKKLLLMSASLMQTLTCLSISNRRGHIGPAFLPLAAKQINLKQEQESD